MKWLSGMCYSITFLVGFFLSFPELSHSNRPPLRVLFIIHAVQHFPKEHHAWNPQRPSHFHFCQWKADLQLTFCRHQSDSKHHCKTLQHIYRQFQCTLEWRPTYWQIVLIYIYSQVAKAGLVGPCDQAQHCWKYLGWRSMSDQKLADNPEGVDWSSCKGCFYHRLTQVWVAGLVRCHIYPCASHKWLILVKGQNDWWTFHGLFYALP